MNYLWTEHDIIPGRWVYLPLERSSRTFRVEEVANRTYKLGFVVGANRDHYVLIAVTDGMVGRPLTKAAMTVNLNEDGYAPMPHKHLLAVIDHLRDNCVAT